MLWRFEITELHKDRPMFTSLDRCVYPFDTSSLWLLAATGILNYFYSIKFNNIYFHFLCLEIFKGWDNRHTPCYQILKLPLM